MGLAVSLLLPLALWALAFFLARRELRLYRAGPGDGTDLFLYTRGRLWRRMSGVGVLVLLGGTLAALELFPAHSPSGASIYMGLLLGEVVVLLVLPFIDLWETARSAKPHDLTRQGGPAPRTRTGSRPPP